MTPITIYRRHRAGSASGFAVSVFVALALLVVLGYWMLSTSRPSGTAGDDSSRGSDSSASLFVYCAAGIRAPVEAVKADYEQRYGTAVQLQYGGSNTLLSQLEFSRTGDLFLAADDSYLRQAVERGLVRETIPLAVMRPVILVAGGNPKHILGIDDLLRSDVRTALGNPDQAAIGKKTRELLTASGHWERLQNQVTQTGVFKPTVPEIANDVKIGSVDAAIVWDTTAAQYKTLEAVRTVELDAGTAQVAIGVLTSCQNPARALRFARFLAARDQGLLVFQADGFQTVAGDVWAEIPQLNFFCGAVNRRAVASVIKTFEDREGVQVNTVYNGCGILTAQMRSIHDQRQTAGFPDTYMACDRFYLDSVKEWFQEDVDISDTEVVIAVPRGNPAKIHDLQDLTRPGIRVSLGQPDQCTIGVLTREILQQENVYEAVMRNVATQTATSAMLIPTVTTGAVDASLTYLTDTLAESDKVEAIRIPSAAARAIQPFAISRTSDHKHLARRFYQAISQARDQFEDAGFHFRVPTTPRETQIAP